MKISVMILAYNHERFIQQAVESVLMQKGAPDFEIVIGEDRSTDNTRVILERMVRKNPEKIRIRFSETNIGTNKNYIRTFRDCRGEYIAILDGDDYWTNPEKLKKQALFLDENPSSAICFHNALVLYEDEEREPRNYVSPEQNIFSSLVELLSSNFMPTCSVMFRNHLFADVPDWYYQLKMSDFPLHILNAHYGLIGYIDEIMATYRVHSGGIWGMIDFEKQLKADIELYRILEHYLDQEYKGVIESALQKRFVGLAMCLKEKALRKGTIQEGIEMLCLWLKDVDASLRPTKAWISSLLSSVYMDYAFLSYERNEPKTAHFCMTRAINLSPSWIRNRGVRSIWFRTLVG